jgi:hypothetical protein
MVFTPIAKREIFSYAQHKSLRICGLRGVELTKNSLTFGLFERE